MRSERIAAAQTELLPAYTAEEQGGTLPNFKEGQLIQGVVTEADTTLAIQFGAHTLRFSPDAVQNARTGEIRSFQVVEVSSQSVVLKEVQQSTSANKGGTLICGTSTEHRTQNTEEPTEEEQLDEEETQLQKAVSQISTSDYEALSSEATPLEEWNLDRLMLALARIKQQRMVKTESLERQQAQLEVQAEQLLRVAVGAAADTPYAREIALRLLQADLPVTEETIKRISRSVEMGLDAVGMSDRSVATLLAQDDSPTISDLYKAAHCKTGATERSLSDAVWSELQPAAAAVAAQTQASGLTNADTNTLLSDSRWLIANGLPLTQQQLLNKQALDALRTEPSATSLIQACVTAVSVGIAPEDAPLFDHAALSVRQSVADAQTTAASVTDSDILTALRQQAADNAQTTAPVTDQNANRQTEGTLIRPRLTSTQATDRPFSPQAANTQHTSTPNTQKTEASRNTQNTAIDAQAAEQKADTQTEDTLSLAALREAQNTNPQAEASSAVTTAEALHLITAKRQLEEIRLKLTVEAGRALAGKGISIQTDSLTRVVEGLRELETEYMQKLWQESEAAGAGSSLSTVTQETALPLLQETLTGIARLGTMPNYILGQSLSTRAEETIQSLLTQGEATRAALDRAREAYETLGTQPQAELGDSMQKAFQNIDSLLQTLGLEATAANRRAARILGYNQMELTEASVNAMKQYDASVSAVIQGMRPSAALSLIRNGINPLETPIDALNESLDALREPTDTQAERTEYGEFLVALERKNGISETERSAYIGIYRLLHQIEKTDGAAIGALVKSGRAVTLGNLLTEARTRRSGGVDLTADETTGVAEQVLRTGTQIPTQITEGLAAAEPYQNHLPEAASPNSADRAQLSYQNRLLRQTLDGLSPDALSEVTQAEELEAVSLERLAEQVRAHAQDSTRAAATERLSELRGTATDCREALRLLHSFGIPPTLQRLSGAKALQDKATLAEQAQTLASDTETEPSIPDFVSILDDKEALDTQYQAFHEDLDALVAKAYEKGRLDVRELASLGALQNGIALSAALGKQEHYEIPLQTGDALVKLNLTILHGQGSESLRLTVPTETYGTVGISVNVQEQTLQTLVTGESREAVRLLTQQEEALRDSLQTVGFTADAFRYLTAPASMLSVLGGAPQTQPMDNPAQKAVVNATSNTDSTTQNNQGTDTDTRTDAHNQSRTDALYAVAKALVMQLRQGR